MLKAHFFETCEEPPPPPSSAAWPELEHGHRYVLIPPPSTSLPFLAVRHDERGLTWNEHGEQIPAAELAGYAILMDLGHR